MEQITTDTQNTQSKDAINNLARFTLEIPDKLSLYTAYMPYIKNGGLFVNTILELNHSYKLGQLVMVEFKLASNTPIYFIGTIVWICPSNASERVSGIGVELPDDESSQKLRQNIEKNLGQALNSSRATHIL
jgi:type IV pilus assembly protein PilZ